METVRSFLAEWITRNVREPNWEPEIPKTSVEFDTEENFIYEGKNHLAWRCQRELQTEVAKC